jgi:DNA-binding CsgD family transcriptional regulator/tetratricopeptide (TPR) repeat protein
MAATAESVAEPELLEREPFLEALARELATVAGTGEGRLVLLTGEAGAGKTVLLKRFCKDAESRCLSGACDALLTPRALGPLLDIAEQVGGPLRDLIERSPLPRDVLTGLFAELRRDPPSLVILEDVHWADGATLDVLRLLARRIDAVPALVIASLRDDELDKMHPARLVLGELATLPTVRRFALPPLSRNAVWSLSAPRGVDGDDLYERTGGNAFYVTEVLESGTAAIPATVRDAVLARATRLSAGAQRLLEAVSIAQPHAEVWLLEAIGDDASRHLDECIASGMLRVERHAVAFRHELARLAFEQSIAPHRRLALHRAALRALVDPAHGEPDPARVAHHAEEAWDAEAVLAFAPAAGERAMRLYAFREAAAQFARALRFADGVDLDRKCDLLEQHSASCYLSEQLDDALSAREEALACVRTMGNRPREGESLRWLARLLWCVGRTREARAAAREAIEVLEQFPPSSELALAYSSTASLFAARDDTAEAIEWANKALALAEEVGDTVAQSNAFVALGNMEATASPSEGIARIEHAIEISRRTGNDETLIRGLSNLALAGVSNRRYEVADKAASEGIGILADLGISYWSGYLHALRARSAFEQGRWDEATEFAERALARPGTLPLARLEALVVRGRVRARRGDPGVWPPLEEALLIAQPTDELQQIGPVAAARAEAALLAGEPETVAPATEVAYELGLQRRSPWLLGELAMLRSRAGIDEPAPEAVAEPYALAAAGQWQAAAARWTEIGCPYEAAEALAASGEEDALRRALAAFERLGARPAAAAAAGRLRELVARGPRPTTTENPANLTSRELEVLVLIAEGLRNADIAERLVISQRTVDHHVSAILRKLGARSRAEAGATAVRLGLTPR